MRRISGKKIKRENMKKYLYMIMAAAALIAVGCEKNIETNPEGDETLGSCSLTIDLPVDTKITFDGAENYKSCWDEGDQILVQIAAGKYQVYDLSSGAGKKRATFTGSGVPYNGGMVLYPAKIKVAKDSYAGWETSDGTAKYKFPDTYVWDESANEANKINSVVPMAGKINGTTITDFDYVAGAISITYSKVTLTTAKFVITLGGTTPTGFATLNAAGTPVSAGDGGNTITIKMKEDGSQIGGTPTNARFFIPVPAGTYSSLNMKLYREDDQIVGGSDFSAKKSFSVANKELKVLPTIQPNYPYYYFSAMTTNEAHLTKGEYILAYKIDDTHAWVNGDDDIREVIPASIQTIDEIYFAGTKYENVTAIKLDQADYETGAWKLTYQGNSIWNAATAGKGIFEIRDGGWSNQGFFNVAYLTDAEVQNQSWWNPGTTTYYAWCKWIRYRTAEEMRDKTSDLYSEKWEDSKFDNGVFLIPSPNQNQWTTNSNPNFDSFSVVQQSNIILFRLIGSDSE